MVKISAVFNKINSLRERYYKASIDKKALIKLVSEAEIADQVYNSNAIENSQTNGAAFQRPGQSSPN